MNIIAVVGGTSRDLASLRAALHADAVTEPSPLEVRDAREVSDAGAVVRLVAIARGGAAPVVPTRLWGVRRHGVLGLRWRGLPPSSGWEGVLWDRMTPGWAARVARAARPGRATDDKSTVFISYRHVDGAAAAAQLHDRLVAVGFRCLRDTEVLAPGDVLTDRVRGMMADSDVVLQLCTQGAVDPTSVGVRASSWMADEALMARTYGVLPVTVLWPGVPAPIRTGASVVSVASARRGAPLSAAPVAEIVARVITTEAIARRLRRARLSDNVEQRARTAARRSGGRTSPGGRSSKAGPARRRGVRGHELVREDGAWSASRSLGASNARAGDGGNVGGSCSRRGRSVCPGGAAPARVR